MLKPSLQLRIGQQLTMTPQLQQAIRLLQLPVMDLQTEIQEAIENNVMLEVEEPTAFEETQESPPQAETPGATAEELEVEYAEVSTLGLSVNPPLPDDLRDNRDFPDTGGDILKNHLVWQLEMDRFDDDERAAGRAVIDSLNDDGYLMISHEEIAACLRPEIDLGVESIATVVAKIQKFDPVGVAARDLSECLIIQLSQLDKKTKSLDLAQKIATDYLDLVAGRQYPALRRRLGASSDDLDQALELLRSLNPRPGSSLPSGTPEYIIPDVFVKRHESRWVVEANPVIAPRLKVNQAYAQSISRKKDYQVLRTQLQEARWLVKSLEIRNDTLIRVARCIIERQESFLESGEEAMKPMILRDVSESLQLHESTVSRATTGKYMHTPRGVFEFRFFFSSHVSNSSGGETSSTAIRAQIRRLIASENPAKPLSDNAITKKLREEGCHVARRTVAKYRESLGLGSSSERRRMTAR
jgi:RNA polymerase sigma-54 factor